MLAGALLSILTVAPLPPGSVSIDAFFDEWPGLTALPVDRALRGSLVGPDDLVPTVQLAITGDRLNLALQVRDDLFQRGTATTGDGVEILYRPAAGKPGDARRFLVVLHQLEGQPAEVRRDGHPVKGAAVASTLRKDGWAVELALPLDEMPGIREGEVGLVVTLRDSDHDPTEIETVMTSGPVGPDGLPAQPTLRIDAAGGLYEDYTRERGGVARVLERRRGEVAGDASPEEVVVNDVDLVVAGRGLPGGSTWFYFTHGWGEGSTLARFDLMELDGRPGKEILVEHVEHAPDVNTEVMEIYAIQEGILKRVFAQKLAETFPGMNAEARSRFKVLPAKGKGPARFEIIVATLRNLDEGTYPPEPAGVRSYQPIPLPWTEPRSVIFALEGEFWQRQ